MKTSIEAIKNTLSVSLGLISCILFILFNITGCSDMPYTGSMMQPGDVDKYLVYPDENTICLQNGYDSACITLVPKRKDSRVPVIHIYPKRIVYVFYYEGAAVMRVERETDTSDIRDQLTGGGGIPPGGGGIPPGGGGIPPGGGGIPPGGGRDNGGGGEDNNGGGGGDNGGGNNGGGNNGGGGTNQPDTNQPDTNQPDTNQPDTNQPDTNQPDTNQPDTNQPDTNQPDTNQPDTNQPDTNQPDTNQPDTNQPDTNQPDTNQPDTNQPDTNQPDTNQPDTNQPDTNQPDTNQPDTNQPDTNQPDTNQPDTNTPDTNTPDTNTPDTNTPDTNTPDTNTPDTNTPVINPSGHNPPDNVLSHLVYGHADDDPPHSSGDGWIVWIFYPHNYVEQGHPRGLGIDPFDPQTGPSSVDDPITEDRREDYGFTFSVTGGTVRGFSQASGPCTDERIGPPTFEIEDNREVGQDQRDDRDDTPCGASGNNYSVQFFVKSSAKQISITLRWNAGMYSGRTQSFTIMKEVNMRDYTDPDQDLNHTNQNKWK